jgi:hypothetical protein
MAMYPILAPVQKPGGVTVLATTPFLGAEKPFNESIPVITGGKVVGGTLTCAPGTWTETPTSYAYAWKSGGVVVGTNANTYISVVGDIGNLITCDVTATNSHGSTTASAMSYGPITATVADPEKVTVTTTRTVSAG